MTLFHLFLVNFREETSLSTYPFTMYKHTYMHTAHTFSSHTKKKRFVLTTWLLLRHINYKLIKLEILEWENCRIGKDFEIFNTMKHNEVVNNIYY